MRESIELRHLKYFVTLADELHFGRAAARLFISQPPLSQQIKAMEDELGTTLFDRNRKGLSLTREGETLLRRAHAILGMTRSAIDEVKQVAAGRLGTLRIGYMSAAMLSKLPPLIRTIRESSGSIDIVLNQMSPDDQMNAVAEGRIDVGFVDLIGQREPLAVKERTLKIEVAWKEELVAMLPPGFTKAGKNTLALDKLAPEPFVMIQRSQFPGFFDKVVALCQQSGFSPRVAHFVRSFPEAVALVSAGCGVSFAPRESAMLWAPQVLFARVADRPMTDVSIVSRLNDDSPLVKLFCEIAKGSVAQIHRKQLLGSRHE